MGEDGRAAPRSKLLLAAALRVTGGASLNVMIRDLSATGALVEAPRVPKFDSDVELVRGSLVATGSIAWAQEGRCGVRFHAPIDLEAWLPNRVLSAGQLRVDKIQASIRSGEASATTGALKTAQIDVTARVAQELGYVSRLLESLGNDLATDRMTARHGAQLQNLDIAIQLLGHLANVLMASDSVAAIRQIGMEDLRRRLMRKSI
jgi:hypothetical protein